MTQSGELVFVPSKLKARKTGVVYNGKACDPSGPDRKVFSDKAEGVVRIGDEIFYQAHPFYVAGRGDGLVVEDTVKKLDGYVRCSRLQRLAAGTYEKALATRRPTLRSAFNPMRCFKINKREELPRAASRFQKGLRKMG